MRSSILVFCFACAAALWTGCGSTEIDLDAGPEADAGGPSGLIEIESEPSLTLSFLESADLVVRYTEEGRPVAGVQVRIALEGVAHDSMLTDLALTTDADGRARTTVVAGSVTAVFRIRVIADRAAAAYVNVSVSNEGFGGLVVGAVYDGGRESATHRVLQIYSDTSCDPPGGFPRSAARMVTLVSLDEMEHRFGALPAGLVYTVVGSVEGPSGAILATACEDGVTITRDADTRVDLVFSDAALLPDGRYETTLELTALDTPASVSEVATDAGVGFVGGAGATLYLDALEAQLRAAGDDATADALALERTSADAELAGRLTTASTGPEEAVRRELARIAERLEVVRVVGPLEVTVTDGVATASWSTDAIELGAVGVPDGPAAIAIDPTVAMIDPAPEVTLSWVPERDVLAIDHIELALPLGSLLGAALASLANGLASPGAVLLDGAGCDVLASWIADSTTVSGACDAACAEATCLRALDGVVDAMTSAVVDVDSARSGVGVSGEVQLHDDNGDLTVDRLEGLGLTGVWHGLLGLDGDAVTATVSGDRMVD